MNKDEELANKYLIIEGFKNIIFEPDGNTPPDFLCDSEIAVEVRRLNKHINYNDSLKPIEELRSRLIPKFYKLLEEIESDFETYSIIVSLRYERPLKADKHLIKLIKSALYENIPFPEKTKILDITKNLQIQLFNSNLKFTKPILLGAINDRNVGGSVVSMIRENLGIVINEKNIKVQPYLDNHKTWWLILVNRVWDDLDDVDKQHIDGFPKFDSVFDRIILISPNNTDKIEINNIKVSV